MSTLIGDKGYDGDGFRAEIVNRGAKPVIPNKSNRVTLHSFSKRAYKGRNVIERCFCRLKDFRRVATRYDKLARNFLAAVHLAAIVAYWNPHHHRVRSHRCPTHHAVAHHASVPHHISALLAHGMRLHLLLVWLGRHSVLCNHTGSAVRQNESRHREC